MAGIELAKKFDGMKGNAIAKGVTTDGARFVLIKFDGNKGTSTFFDYGSDIKIPLEDIALGAKVMVKVESEYSAVITIPENIF